MSAADEFKNLMDEIEKRDGPELKPCPFCGAKAEAIKREEDGYILVGCSGENNEVCDLITCTMTPDEWNTRPIEDKLRAANKRLRTQLDTTDTALGRAQFLIANALEFAKNYDPAYAVEMIRKLLES
jgi:ssDNA-binding Zn-finger/Zn-ribbon topoisomerase 1